MIRLIATLLSVLVLSSANAGLKVVVPDTLGAVLVVEHNRQQIATGLGFAVRTNLRLLADDELRVAIGTLPFVSGGGLAVKSFDYLTSHDIVIGTSDRSGQLTINHLKQSDNKTHLVVSARSSDGSFVPLSVDNLGAMTINGEQRPIEIEPFAGNVAVGVSFELMIDVSGSMAAHLAKVKEAAVHFIEALPSNAHCRLTTFASHAQRASDAFGACGELRDRIATLKAGGGTNIMDPLLAVYREFEASDDLRAILIITDGDGGSWTSPKTVRAAKNTPTHVYWLGHVKKTRLESIADTELFGSGDVPGLLRQYFGGVGTALRHQYVVTVPNQQTP